MDLLYLDINCFQRGFDDLSQVRIKLEATACQEIFTRADQKLIKLAWSFMLEDETTVCPFPDRKIEVFKLSSLCDVLIAPSSDILEESLNYQKKTSITPKDSLHLACANKINAGFFLTCDDKLIKQGKRIELKMAIMNPLDYIRGVKT